MPVDNFLKFIFSISIWSAAKVLVCFALFLYIIFAFVLVKQVNLMTETLAELELPLKAIATIHLILAIFILVIAIFTL